MDGHDERMLGYAELAALAGERGQPDERVRFLVLAGVAACRAGLPDIAETCRVEIERANARHLVVQYETLADALRDPDFEPFLRSLERRYPWEQSEHVLAELGIATDVADADGFRERVSRLLTGN